MPRRTGIGWDSAVSRANAAEKAATGCQGGCLEAQKTNRPGAKTLGRGEKGYQNPGYWTASITKIRELDGLVPRILEDGLVLGPIHLQELSGHAVLSQLKQIAGG